MAALPQASKEDVEAVAVSSLDNRFHDDVHIDVELGSQSGDLVFVLVSVPKNTAAPDLLWPIGFELDGSIVSRSCMIKE